MKIVRMVAVRNITTGSTMPVHAQPDSKTNTGRHGEIAVPPDSSSSTVAQLTFTVALAARQLLVSLVSLLLFKSSAQAIR